MDLKENLTMAGSGNGSGFSGVIHRWRLMKRSVLLIVLLNAACVILGAFIWMTAIAKLDADQRSIEEHTVEDAVALAHTYARYLARSVEQIDHITLLVKYEWARSNGHLKLDELLTKDIFRGYRFTDLMIVDRDGIALAGTLPPDRASSLAESDYFRFHVQNKDAVLHIGKPEIGRISGKTVVQFTRRLETAAGAFDGVVAVAVEPAFFASFYEGANLGKDGLLAVLARDGSLRMAGIGGASDGRSNPLLDKITLLDTASSGAQRLAQEFNDGKARFVAWKALTDYPLIAVAGLSADERLAAGLASSRAYRNGVIAVMLALAVTALIGTMSAARFAWRKQKAAEVRNVYRVATEGGDEGFYMLRPIHDSNGVVIDFEVADCNERAAGLSGYSAADFAGKRLSQLYEDPYRSVVVNTFCRAMATGYFEDELEVPPESPINVRWIHRKFVRSGAALALTIRDISQAKAHEKELWRMANEDVLTGLPNRNWLMGFLAETLERIKQKNGTLGLLFVDLDDFKDVNDSLGHSAGDELLQAAARRLRSVLRSSDHVVRLGGDEFTIIIEPLENPHYASDVADRITAIFSQSFELAGGRNTIGASVGISVFPQDGEDAEALLKHSDIAMYHAKAQGRGHYRFYEPGMLASLTARLDTERALKIAIEADEFVMYYQPRVCTFTGELHSLEALVRWQHPVRGIVPPLEFIALAEETGLILKLGDMIVEKVCRQVAQWKTLRTLLVPVSINVSPRQFNDGDIKTVFARALATHHLGADLIEIEITESSMMGDAEEVSRQLAALRALGIRLLVDDFGTGYSSLSTLQKLDMDVLKVDRAFAVELDRGGDGEVFFRAIMSMAQALGMRVVAEGVETSAQLRALQALGCDEIQGYLIARPIPADEVPAMLLKRFLLPAELMRSRPMDTG